MPFNYLQVFVSVDTSSSITALLIFWYLPTELLLLIFGLDTLKPLLSLDNDMISIQLYHFLIFFPFTGVSFGKFHPFSPFLSYFLVEAFIFKKIGRVHSKDI